MDPMIHQRPETLPPNKNAIDNHSVNSFSRQEIKRFVPKSDNNGIDSQWEQKPIK